MQRKLLVLSHVLPFPRASGQQQRVFYTLQAAKQSFHVTFATTVRPAEADVVRDGLAEVCDASRLLPSRYGHGASRVWHHCLGGAHVLRTGVGFSNYVIGRLEFAPARVPEILGFGHFDCVLFEYWHAAESVPAFHAHNIPCVLDMHDILWQSRAQRLDETRCLPTWCRRWLVQRYRRREEAAWNRFEAVIAINREEQRYVESRVSRAVKVFYTPMGTDLALWSASWAPVTPARVAYYGALGTSYSRAAALRCAKEIMPAIWARRPEIELWLVGSNPAPEVQALATQDRRIRVTGYVADAPAVLRTMTLVLCPWVGTYGFRSRLVEVMALGVPVVATPDAVAGMEVEDGEGLLLGRDSAALAQLALYLLEDPRVAREQSWWARRQVVARFSLASTYEHLVHELDEWLTLRR